MPRWEPALTYRVNLRLKDGPFVDRRAFVAEDTGAFAHRAESGSGADWMVTDGMLAAAAAAGDGATAQYAVFGEPDWLHLVARTAVDPGGHAAGIAVSIELGSSAPFAVTGAIEAVIDESAGATLRLTARSGGAIVATEEIALPAGSAIPYLLEIASYDDVVRASVGSSKVELPRGALRGGRLALVSRGGGRFMQLAVNAVDAYRFQVRSSRHDDFPAHLATWSGELGVVRPGDVGPAASTIAALVGETSASIASAMTRGADSEQRERLFGRWVRELAIPLRQEPRRLEITRYVVGDATGLLLLESDEPLPFSRDISLAIGRRTTFPPPIPLPLPIPSCVYIPVPVTILTDGTERRALVIPVGSTPATHLPFPSAIYRLTFSIDRPRWRALTPDSTSNYRASHLLAISW